MTQHCIYKIIIDNHIYVGRSKNFRSRMSSHYISYMRCQDCKLYNKIRECGGIENARAEILGFYEVDNIEDINWIEGYWMHTLNSDLNTIIGYKHKSVNNYELIDFENDRRISGDYDFIIDFKENHDNLVVDYVLSNILEDIKNFD